MKVSIITMHNFPNYGSVLQAFATQEKMKEYSPEVEIIDYAGGPETVARSLPGFIRLGLRRNLIKFFLNLPIRLRKRAIYGGFARRHMSLTPRQYTAAEELAQFPLHDGFYCSGSDQVWNPYYRENMPFFLDFVPPGKQKFAYAASFGNYREERLSPEAAEKIQGYVDQYAHISMREERGVSFLHEQLACQKAIQIVDPTLAMPPAFWRGLAAPPKVHGDYILVYQLGREKPLGQYAKELSRRTGLPLVRLCSQNFGNALDTPGKRFFLPPVPQFITLIDKAKYVVTDSFHGAAFSLNLNREFVVYREEYDGDRIAGFLRLVGQEDRYIKSIDDFSFLEKPLDTDHVNRVLNEERRRVDTFLSSVFCGEKGSEGL